MTTRIVRPARRRFAAMALALATIVGTSVIAVAQNRREFNVTGRRYSFQVSGNDASEIRVMQNDLVQQLLRRLAAAKMPEAAPAPAPTPKP